MKKYKEYLKSIIIVMGTNGFVYFLIKLALSNYNVLNSFLDVPLIKSFVFFYDSWYPFVILAAFFIYLHDHETYYKLIFSIIISAILSYITFVIYPTMVIRPDIEVKTVVDWLLDFTYRTDSPAINCFPSLHSIFCLLISYYIYKCQNMKKTYKIGIIIYSTLIVLSTVFIKQHIVEDVICSIIYVIIALVLVHYFSDKLKKLLKYIF